MSRTGHTVLRSPAWLLSGFTRSLEGELLLTRGRVIFETLDKTRVFDAALGDVSAVSFPWYYFGGGLKLRAGADAYRVSFVRPGNLAEDFSERRDVGDIASGRRAGAEWRRALAEGVGDPSGG